MLRPASRSGGTLVAGVSWDLHGRSAMNKTATHSKLDRETRFNADLWTNAMIMNSCNNNSVKLSLSLFNGVAASFASAFYTSPHTLKGKFEKDAKENQL